MTPPFALPIFGETWVKPPLDPANWVLRSVAEGLRELALDPLPSPRRLTKEEARDGRSGSPRIGAVCEMGDPGSTPIVVRGAE